VLFACDCHVSPMSSLVIADEGELMALYGIRVCMCVTVALYGIASYMYA
jgi:hypothetical protein